MRVKGVTKQVEKGNNWRGGKHHHKLVNKEITENRCINAARDRRREGEVVGEGGRVQGEYPVNIYTYRKSMGNVSGNGYQGSET